MKIKLWLLFYILNVPVSERGNEVKWKISASSQEIKIKEEKNSRNTQTLKSALSGM